MITKVQHTNVTVELITPATLLIHASHITQAGLELWNGVLLLISLPLLMCVSVHVYTVPSEAWSYRRLCARCGCWDPNFGPGRGMYTTNCRVVDLSC